MSDDFQSRVTAAMVNPQNMGELPNADSIGTVGSAECGDMLRVWVKFKEEGGRKVIDRASFQSFGCETAIAAASLAMELIRGKTPAEALAMRGEELAKDLGPLPPTKVHCTALVEGAIRQALEPAAQSAAAAATASSSTTLAASASATAPASLMDSFNKPDPKKGGVKVVFLRDSEGPA